MEVPWSNTPLKTLLEQQQQKGPPGASFLLRVIRTRQEYEAALYAMAERKELDKRKQKVHLPVHKDYIASRPRLGMHIQAWEGYYEVHKVKYARRPTINNGEQVLTLVLKYKKVHRKHV